jgi:hypothetical protein
MCQRDNGTRLLYSSFNRQFNPCAKFFNRKRDATLAGTITYAISKKRDK